MIEGDKHTKMILFVCPPPPDTDLGQPFSLRNAQKMCENCPAPEDTLQHLEICMRCRRKLRASGHHHRQKAKNRRQMKEFNLPAMRFFPPAGDLPWVLKLF